MLNKRLIWSFLLVIGFFILFPLTSFAQAPVTLETEVHLENIGWKERMPLQNDGLYGTTGEHRKLEGIRIYSSDPNTFNLRFRSHSENIGWQDFVGNGELSGSTGQNSGIEAFTISLDGTSKDQYQVYFRAHVESYGWTNWAQQNQLCGTTCLNKQIEAIQIQVFPDGTMPQLPEGNVSWAYHTNNDVYYPNVVQLVGVFPHDSGSFLEGLSFYNGRLYESSGRYGHSNLYKNINIPTNQAEIVKKIDNKYFGEGSVVFNGKLYLLTYKEKEVLTYNPETLELMEVLPYHNREGWGLTTDGTHLIAGDGSNHLYFMDGNLNDIRVLDVTFNGQPVTNINELEYIDGYIWANIWQTKDIVIINPNNGVVERKLNFNGLYNGKGEVMNGIAFNPETRKLYLTGKWWENMYEFDLKSYYNFY